MANPNDEDEVDGRTDLLLQFSYPENPDYDYETQLVRINLDNERKDDIISNNGFILGPTKGIKKDIKDQESIFSGRFGQTLKDLNPFANRYKCQCGFYQKRIRRGMTCPVCGTKVEFVDDNFEYFAWEVLKYHQYIHPALYMSIKYFIGKDFGEIIKPERRLDIDGNEKQDLGNQDDKRYYGIGILGFIEKFDEIMSFYLAKNKGKKVDYYEDIMADRDKVFTSSIPVFTALLRPSDVDKTTFSHEDTNGTYYMISKLGTQLNIQAELENQLDSDMPIEIKDAKNKSTNDLLYDLQRKVMELYQKVIDIISGKRGTIRTLFGGRYNFSGRDVIVGNPDLRIDEVTLPYKSLVELLSQKIINILHRSYSMTLSEAYSCWWKANIQKDPLIERIINTIIEQASSEGRGLPIIINRNPTIEYGSILQMYCVGMTDTYTMAVPLPVLPILAADFDWTHWVDSVA